MPDKHTKPVVPALFSPDWWVLRNATMAEIAAEQARLRRAYPLEGDRDPALQAAIARRSKAAVELALYGESEERAALYDAACVEESRLRRK